MNEEKQGQKMIDWRRIDLTDKKVSEKLLSRQLSKLQLSIILQRIKSLLRQQRRCQSLATLNNLKKELKSKYSIKISEGIISEFISVTDKVSWQRPQLEFEWIQRQIKSSLQEINKKKFYLNMKNKKQVLSRKIISAQKRKRRNILNNKTIQVMPQIRSIKNFDQIFIKEKLIIFRDYLDDEDLNKFEQELIRRMESIEQLNYGKFSERMKHYTAYDLILQKIFSLVQQNTKNIEIRQRFHQAYIKMKEQMVAIVTNEQQVLKKIKKFNHHSQDNITKPYNKHAKNYYFQNEKDKQQLTLQIEETLQLAKKHLKEAFIKRGRPDHAYEMELLLDNRSVGGGLKRTRF